MVRPKQRTRTLQFSNAAVVCRRDGKLCFMFRVGDLRRSHIIEAKMRVLLIQARTTREGELVSPSRTELKVPLLALGALHRYLISHMQPAGRGAVCTVRSRMHLREA